MLPDVYVGILEVLKGRNRAKRRLVRNLLGSNVNTCHSNGLRRILFNKKLFIYLSFNSQASHA